MSSYDKSIFAKNLNAQMQRNNVSVAEICSLLGVTKTTVSAWRNAQKTPRMDKIEMLASHFGCKKSDLIEGKTFTARSKGVRIPVLGSVVAGVPVEAVEDILDYEEITEEMASTGDFFALQIKGDSMEPRIRAGDVVIVRKQSDVESGQIAIVLVNGDEATCKKYVKHDNGISLVSFNSAYSPMFYTANEAEQKPVRIIGRVVELRGKF